LVVGIPQRFTPRMFGQRQVAAFLQPDFDPVERRHALGMAQRVAVSHRQRARSSISSRCVPRVKKLAPLMRPAGHLEDAPENLGNCHRSRRVGVRVQVTLPVGPAAATA
jgi:hypothetical protein